MSGISQFHSSQVGIVAMAEKMVAITTIQKTTTMKFTFRLVVVAMLRIGTRNEPFEQTIPIIQVHLFQTFRNPDIGRET